MDADQKAIVIRALQGEYAAYASKRPKSNADREAMARIQEAREAFEALYETQYA